MESPRSPDPAKGGVESWRMGNSGSWTRLDRARGEDKGATREEVGAKRAALRAALRATLRAAGHAAVPGRGVEGRLGPAWQWLDS